MTKPILKPLSTLIINAEFDSQEGSEAGEQREDKGMTKNEIEIYKKLIKGKRKINRQKRGAMRLQRSDTHIMMESLKLEKIKSVVNLERMPGSPTVRGLANNSFTSHEVFDRARA